MFYIPQQKININCEPFNPKSARKLFSTISFSLFLMLFISIALQYSIIVLTKHYIPQLASASWFLWAITFIPLYFFGFPILLVFMKSQPIYSLQKQKLDNSTLFELLLICFGAMYAGNILGNTVAYILGAITGNSFSNPLLDFLSGSGFIFNLIATVLIAPVMEEFIFRKLIIDRTMKYGESVSVWISALLFGLYHGNIFQLFYAFLLGAIFAFIYVKTGNLKYCIFFHSTINLFGGIIAPLLMGSKLIFVYSSIMLLLSISGMVLFFRRKQAMTLSEGEIVIPREQKKSIVFINTGTILLFLLVLFLIVTNLTALS